MVETDGTGCILMLIIVNYLITGNCYSDKVKFGSDLATYLYACSLFHSLPVGSNSEGNINFFKQILNNKYV